MKAPPQQLELVRDEPRVARKADEIHALAVAKYRSEIMPVLAAAVARLTSKECGTLFDAKPSHISDAIAFREINGSVRAFDVEWIVALLLAAPESTKLEILAAFCSAAGYRAPERKRELSAVEELRAYKAAVKRAAPAIDALAEREVEEA